MCGCHVSHPGVSSYHEAKCTGGPEEHLHLNAPSAFSPSTKIVIASFSSLPSSNTVPAQITTCLHTQVSTQRLLGPVHGLLAGPCLLPAPGLSLSGCRARFEPRPALGPTPSPDSKAQAAPFPLLPPSPISVSAAHFHQRGDTP